MHRCPSAGQNAATFTVAIGASGWKEALALLSVMKSKSLQLNEIPINAAISSCEKGILAFVSGACSTEPFSFLCVCLVPTDLILLLCEAKTGKLLWPSSLSLVAGCGEMLSPATDP